MHIPVFGARAGVSLQSAHISALVPVPAHPEYAAPSLTAAVSAYIHGLRIQRAAARLRRMWRARTGRIGLRLRPPAFLEASMASSLMYA